MSDPTGRLAREQRVWVLFAVLAVGFLAEMGRALRAAVTAGANGLGPDGRWASRSWKASFRPLMILAFILAAAGRGDSVEGDAAAFTPLFRDEEIFRAAILRDDAHAVRQFPVSGISVPHHLLAADLIARGFWAAAANTYDRIIILSPDHFNRSRRPLATTRRDFATVFGMVRNDRDASAALLEATQLFDDSDLFEKEHGIAALLPFVRHFFPDVRIVPIAIANDATRADWDDALALIAKLTQSRVLVIQSTDY